jgi:hypothetical protein
LDDWPALRPGDPAEEDTLDPDAIDPLNHTGRGRIAADVTLARQTLDTARSALDRAVAALPDVAGDEAMATPAVLLLLLGVVKAKEHLSRLEALQAGHLAKA